MKTGMMNICSLNHLWPQRQREEKLRTLTTRIFQTSIKLRKRALSNLNNKKFRKLNLKTYKPNKSRNICSKITYSTRQLVDLIRYWTVDIAIKALVYSATRNLISKSISMRKLKNDSWFIIFSWKSTINLLI